LQDSDDGEDYKQQIENLEKEVKTIKREKKEELAKANKKHLADLEVLKHNPYDPEDVIAFIDMEKVELSEDGKNLIGFTDQVEALKERKKHFFQPEPNGEGDNQEGEGDNKPGEGDNPPGNTTPPYSAGNQASGNSQAGGGSNLSAYERGKLAAEARHKKAAEQ
jgi:hypothetical protein